jgi:uncharacterized protein with von Willebrand factor type A (vWA) domain
MTTGLVSHLVRFARALRHSGIPVGTGEVEAACRSLLHIDPTDRDTFRLTLRANLVHCQDDLVAFDRVFEAYWAAGGVTAEGEEALGLAGTEATRAGLVLGTREAAGTREEQFGQAESVTSGVPYSAREVFWPREVGARPSAPVGRGEGLPAVRRLLVGLPGGMASRRAGARGRIDLGATLRDLRRAGGEPIRLRWRRRPARRPALILAVDVSGSMERYLPEVLDLLLATSRLAGRVELFAFSTRLERVTPLIRGFRPDLARRRLHARVPRWSGGTRIGECLARVRAGLLEMADPERCTLVIVSDGWDRGDPDLVGREMRRLRERSRAIVWVNPLLDRPGYVARSPAMLAALPAVDRFLSLEGFRAALSSIGARHRLERRAD